MKQENFKRGDHVVVQWDEPQTCLVLEAGGLQLWVVPCPFAHNQNYPLKAYTPDPYAVSKELCRAPDEDYSRCECLSMLGKLPPDETWKREQVADFKRGLSGMSTGAGQAWPRSEEYEPLADLRRVLVEARGQHPQSANTLRLFRE